MTLYLKLWQPMKIFIRFLSSLIAVKRIISSPNLKILPTSIGYHLKMIEWEIHLGCEIELNVLTADGGLWWMYRHLLLKPSWYYYFLLSFSYLETCSQIDRCFCLSSGLNIIVHFRAISYSEIYSMLAGVSIWLIVINKIRQILWKNLDFLKFRKLLEVIWPTVINEFFKFPPHFEHFAYVNYWMNSP